MGGKTMAATIAIIVVLLLAVPILIVLWLYAFTTIDDVFFNGLFQGKMRRWSRKEWEKLEKHDD